MTTVFAWFTKIHMHSCDREFDMQLTRPHLDLECLVLSQSASFVALSLIQLFQR